MRFAPRELPEADATAYVLKNLSGGAYRYRARVTLHASEADVVQRHPQHLQGQITALDGDRCELRTSDDHLDWLAMRIGMLGVGFEVHEPPELVERMRELGERFVLAATPG